MVQPRKPADRARGRDRPASVGRAVSAYGSPLRKNRSSAAGRGARDRREHPSPRGRGFVYALLSGGKKRRAQCGAFAFCAAFRGVAPAGPYRGGGALREAARPAGQNIPRVAPVGRHERAAAREAGRGRPAGLHLHRRHDRPCGGTAARPRGRTAGAAVPVGRGAR